MLDGEFTMLLCENSSGMCFATFLFEWDDDEFDDSDLNDDYDDSGKDLDDLDYAAYDSDFDEDFDYGHANGDGDAHEASDDDCYD
jgi:hypothetical protein